MKTWTGKQTTLKITRDELIALGIPEKDIETGESRGKIKTYGPWGIPIAYKALTVSWEKHPTEKQYNGYAKIVSETAHGIRTLTNIRQGGYELEGYVSINGKKYSAFTSSQLFELEDGKLVDVATIHARIS